MERIHLGAMHRSAEIVPARGQPHPGGELPLDLTADLKGLAQLASKGDGVEDLLRRGLDWLGRLTPYDLATVFTFDADPKRPSRLVVRAARGKLAGAVRGHALDLDSFPSIREALETRRARAFTEDDHASGDGDPFDGVLDLPDGHACMVVPLCVGERCLGVLTLDRARCETFPRAVVDLVEVYALLLALALTLAEQRGALERLREQALGHAALLEREIAPDPALPFDRSEAPAMGAVLARARQVARADTPVLLLGETGTGKERLARALHGWSQRKDGPFLKINCAAIPAFLIESELFGHVRGSFTGATRDRAGRFQTANGGTLLLDEIGEMPLELQAKLLRVLQEGTFEPVGSDRTLKVDVRVFAATNVDPEAAVSGGRLRQDLYYRLSVFPLRLPPLRERLEDLPHLCEALLDELAGRTGRPKRRVTPAGLSKLARHSWPGNIRELGNVLERATILGASRELGPEVLELPGRDRERERELPGRDRERERARGASLRLEDVERAHIEDVLARTSGRIYGAEGAAALLGLPPSTLQSRMKKLGIRRPG